MQDLFGTSKIWQKTINSDNKMVVLISIKIENVTFILRSILNIILAGILAGPDETYYRNGTVSTTRNKVMM